MPKYNKQNFPKRILITSADRLGDALFITPGIRLLKTQFPNLILDVLAFSNLAATVFDNNPYINKVIVLKNSSKISALCQNYPLVICLMQEMHRHIKPLPPNLESIHYPDVSRGRAEQVLQYLNSLIELDAFESDMPYDFFLKEQDLALMKARLEKEGIDLQKDIIVTCQLGCSRLARRGWKFWSSKRHLHKKVWPIEHYAQLAISLRQKNPAIKFILVGAPNEQYLAKLFYKLDPKSINLIGETSLHELGAILKLSQAIVTHDTGTLHIACALKRPLVALFAATPVVFTGPYPKLVQFKVIENQTMANISVEEVHNEVMNLTHSNFA